MHPLIEDKFEACTFFPLNKWRLVDRGFKIKQKRNTGRPLRSVAERQSLTSLSLVCLILSLLSFSLIQAAVWLSGDF